MFRFLLIALLVALTSAFMAPIARVSQSSMIVMNGGKGFGGGEATRDPAPTAYDPNDPKGKQQAIHKAESFAEYLAKRNAGGEAVAAPAAAAAAPAAPSAPSVFKPPVDESAAKAAWLAKQGTKGQWGRAAAAAAAVTGNVVASAPAAAPHGGKGFGGGEATRDPEPTAIDPNDPKGKQQAIHKAESFAEYLAKRASTVA